MNGAASSTPRPMFCLSMVFNSAVMSHQTSTGEASQYFVWSGLAVHARDFGLRIRRLEPPKPGAAPLRVRVKWTLRKSNQVIEDADDTYGELVELQ